MAQTGRPDEARSVLQTCLILDPAHADARENLADLLDGARDAETAAA
jgi:Flp pilus assembly protein TadD